MKEAQAQHTPEDALPQWMVDADDRVETYRKARHYDAMLARLEALATACAGNDQYLIQRERQKAQAAIKAAKGSD